MRGNHRKKLEDIEYLASTRSELECSPNSLVDPVLVKHCHRCVVGQQQKLANVRIELSGRERSVQVLGIGLGEYEVQFDQQFPLPTDAPVHPFDFAADIVGAHSAVTGSGRPV
ncbi:MULTISPECIES: hypothetical protein [unclassified Rhodococcus (in: high G+C Gram-positive bacteria)]|uniref:hypothetical protein n=1 Tax=unclassified Rhodococcus (in: high G+C Gram-positive bacteria) TaxID=192944 RepID=UPI00211B54D3|nr:MULTISPECIES: hypothetical protein [unclassified Rhodococcus (in: high G+C Gram-positive bacteria)]